jgi:hypothetical protein
VAGDVNGDDQLDLADAVYLLQFLFASGPEPVGCAPAEAGAFRTGQTECYDAGGDTIDCANDDYPGQDALYQAGLEHSYRDNGDGTVTDTVTGLTWEQVPSPSLMTWREALQYCHDLTLGGQPDWRLPNINELHTLVLYDRVWPTAMIDPIFDATVPFSEDWPAWRYWSSSSFMWNTSKAWNVYFSNGQVMIDPKTTRYRVRAVRGGL